MSETFGFKELNEVLEHRQHTTAREALGDVLQTLTFFDSYLLRLTMEEWERFSDRAKTYLQSRFPEEDFDTALKSIKNGEQIWNGMTRKLSDRG